MSLPLGNLDGLQFANFLQIAFTDSIFNQLSTDFRDFEQIKSVTKGAPDGRFLAFMLQQGYGPAAIQWASPSNLAFPKAQEGLTNEYTAEYKEIDATISIPWTLWNRAQKAPSKYAEPLAFEIQSKAIASKRRLAADLYGDGTGIIGTVAAGGVSLVTDGSDGLIEVVLAPATQAKPGHVGFFEFQDLLVAAADDGTQAANYFQVIEKNRAFLLGGPDSVVLKYVNAAGAVVDAAALDGAGLDASPNFYRIGQDGNCPDRTAVVDYGTVSAVMPGLASLAAFDGRKVHGISMSGATSASAIALPASGGVGTNVPDSIHLHRVMDKLKTTVGQSSYSWKKACMAPEAHAYLVDARETDRRFHTVEDNKRGIRFFAYQHGNDTLEVYQSEYVPQSETYILPEAKGGNKVLEFHGTDFEAVRAQDTSSFHLNPAAGGGHEKVIRNYLHALGTMLCLHPAAIGRISGIGADATP